MWTVDWGGTRTKIAWWEDGEMRSRQSFPSPAHWQQVLGRLHPGPLSLALPGRVPLPFEKESLWRYGPEPRREVRGSEIWEACEQRDLHLQLVLQDTAAAGFGAAWGETAYVAQLSTGIAMRIYVDGKLLMHGDDPALLDLAFEEKYEGRSFYDWLRRERRFVDRDWLQIGDARDRAADIFAAFVRAGMKRGPEAGVYLLGGGAEVLRPELEQRLGTAVLGFADPFAASMQGLHNLQGDVPILRSQF